MTVCDLEAGRCYLFHVTPQPGFDGAAEGAAVLRRRFLNHLQRHGIAFLQVSDDDGQCQMVAAQAVHRIGLPH